MRKNTIEQVLLDRNIKALDEKELIEIKGGDTWDALTRWWGYLFSPIDKPPINRLGDNGVRR